MAQCVSPRQWIPAQKCESLGRFPPPPQVSSLTIDRLMQLVPQKRGRPQEIGFHSSWRGASTQRNGVSYTWSGLKRQAYKSWLTQKRRHSRWGHHWISSYFCRGVTFLRPSLHRGSRASRSVTHWEMSPFSQRWRWAILTLVITLPFSCQCQVAPKTWSSRPPSD